MSTCKICKNVGVFLDNESAKICDCERGFRVKNIIWCLHRGHWLREQGIIGVTELYKITKPELIDQIIEEDFVPSRENIVAVLQQLKLIEPGDEEALTDLLLADQGSLSRGSYFGS